MTTKSKPIYETHAEQVAAFFLKGIENGTSQWFKPWKGGDAPDMPYNATTGKPYRGGNVWVLLARQNELVAEGKITDPDDCRWMTYKQALSVGAQVRKGEKSTMGITWGTFEKKDENPKPNKTGEVGADSKLRKSAFASPFMVFHASQIDGLPALEKAPERDLAESVKAGQKIVDDSKAVVILGGDSAHYRPSTDQIRIPHPDQFIDDGHFMATQLHELSHWTGHSSRLNRDFSFDRSDPDYAREELRAEISSYMIGQRLGLPFDPSQHQAYVASWAQRLKDNPKEILHAVKDAEKILIHLNVPERTYEILPAIQQNKGMSMLNDSRNLYVDHNPLIRLTHCSEICGTVRTPAAQDVMANRVLYGQGLSR